MSFLDKLFGGNTDHLSQALKNDATIIDVRSPMEYSNGHVEGSTNIPLDQLKDEISLLPSDRPIVFCCASGARSGVATKLANSNGFNAVNGGPWTNVFQHIQAERK